MVTCMQDSRYPNGLHVLLDNEVSKAFGCYGASVFQAPLSRRRVSTPPQ